jgi:branched-chain amino acid transport system substrate-binding protein
MRGNIKSIRFLAGMLLFFAMMLSNHIRVLTADTSEKHVLRIGMLMSITGFFSVREIPDVNQTKIMAEIINQRGGIMIKGKRYKIELIVEDCKSTMDGVTSAANRLVYNKKVKFIIGPTAFFAPAAVPVCEPNKVLRVLTWCINTPGELDASTPYAFLGGSGTVLASMAATRYLKRRYPDVKKVAIVTPDDGAVPYVVPIAKKLLSAHGISVVGNAVAYPNEMQDFSPIVARLYAKKNIDAIFMINGLVPHMGAIVKGLREIGFDKPFAGSLPARISQVQNIAGKESMKDVFTIACTPGDPSMPPLAREIISRAIKRYSRNYQLEMTGANSLWILKEMIETAQSLDSTVVKKTWESTEKVDTIFGPAYVSGDKTFGIIHHAVASPQPIQISRNGREASGGWIDLGIIP